MLLRNHLSQPLAKAKLKPGNPMNDELFHQLFRQILSQPTAPFHEYHVRDEILRLLTDLPHISTEFDQFGNLIATYQRGTAKPRLAFGAHMDHPAYVRSPETGELEFLGGVPERYRDKNPPVREFGDFAMWDLPEFEIHGSQIHSRVCDDLIGCAAIVALFHELERLEQEATCYGIFTRAEEVGFVGAIQLAQNWPLSPDVCFVSLETSMPVPGIEMGAGPVIRVGDRMSVFDTVVSGDLAFSAEAEKLQVQRALLDLGSCEATAMQHYGVSAAGISVLLGNYHNCGADLQILPEFVEIGDVKGLVALITALVKHAGSQSPSRVEMDRKFEERLTKHAKFADAAKGLYG